MAGKKKGKKVTITAKKGKKRSSAAGKKSTFDWKEVPEDLAERGREVWLAGLGALSMVEEQGTKVFKGLVEKGETWEKEGRKMLGAARGKVESTVDGVGQRGGQVTRELRDLDDRILAGIEHAVESGMQRLGVPTRQEVHDLAGKVEKLAEKVAGLATVIEREKAVEKPAGKKTVYHLVSSDGGWAIKQEGQAQPVSTHGTKDEALEAGRILAQQTTPSRLVVHKQDGTIQTSHAYDA